MARSDLLRGLFAAWSRGDDPAFRAVAGEIVADERRKEHRLLAAELEHALHRDLRPGAAVPLTLRPLPKGRDDRPLLRLSKPEHEPDDLILAPGTAQVLGEVVEEHLCRAALAGHGLRPRQRLLFVGPSGTGKSASAHAIGAQLSLPVATVHLAALIASYLGETARNTEQVVRFAEATPCVLLLDEFDALAGDRSSGSDHTEMRRVVATVLQLLDELRGESVVVATSNHPRLLDAASWRRFDEVVPFTMLEADGLARLVELKLGAVRHHVVTREWSERLAGLTPAEVELVCLDALRRFVLTGAQVLTIRALESSADRVRSRRTQLDAASRVDGGQEGPLYV